jgi:hypothetical protein
LEAELAVKEREQARVAELEPTPLAVKRREREEEVGQRGVLVAEQLGEAGGAIVRVRHAGMVSRLFRYLAERAQMRIGARSRAGGSRRVRIEIARASGPRRPREGLSRSLRWTKANGAQIASMAIALRPE